MRDIPAHYIRENKAAFVPRRMVVFDSESVSVRTGDSETHTWRCGAAAFIHWSNRNMLHCELRTYHEPKAMWVDIGEHGRPKSRTIVYTHNLPYKMRTTRALEFLPVAGFALGAIRVSSQGSWSRWKRDKATLTICDSASIFPVTIYRLGQYLETRRLPMPDGDDIDEWLARCLRNVEILATTMVEYFEWLRTGVAGNWQLTGAGQSWAHWRHAHYTDRVLVHPDSEAIAAERRAMWTGRAEAWQWGINIEAPIYEWDWQNAYPRIARDCDVPTHLVSSARNVSLRDLRVMMSKFVVLADVDVTTSEPVVPARHDGRILWPVGSFSTTLWQPEIELLLASGAAVTVKRVWLYRSAPALRSWATWVLGTLNGREALPHRWLGVLLKHWSRALIGRFATQYQNWELFGLDTESKVLIGKMHDTDTGLDQEFMQVGREVHIMTGLSESDDSCPQITSYVMSVARARLWEAMVAVGITNVLYVDTDSIVTNMAGNAILRTLTTRGSFEGLRLKGRHSGYEIYGPRSAIIGGEEKFAGLPRNSIRTGDAQWNGEVWTQFERALRIGEWDRVTITPRKFTVRWNEHRRARGSDGRTIAYRLPQYEPERPVGLIRPETADERIRHATRALGGRRIDVLEDGSPIDSAADCDRIGGRRIVGD